jgi:putative SOS response-associated peptidase YedK
MCNDFGNRITYADYVEGFAQQNMRVIFPPRDKAPNYPPRDEIWPTELAPVIRPVEGGLEIVEMRWGLQARQPKRPAVINMRTEGRSFEHGRILVPASHFFEFTGSKSPKTRWRFTMKDAAWFCFAGLQGHAIVDGDEVPAFSLLTVPPGPDVAPYHDRQPVILPPEQWAAWLDPSVASQELLRPLPAGSLDVVESPREPPNT